MVVTTVDAADNAYTYVFDIHRSTGRPGQTESNGIAIAPAGEVCQTRLLNQVAIRPNVMQTALGGATLNDISLGLYVAIEQGYTLASDPVVFQVREAVARARNGVSLRSAADSLGLDIAVLTALGEIGVEEGIANPSIDPRGASAPERPDNQPLTLPIYDVELEETIAPLQSDTPDGEEI